MTTTQCDAQEAKVKLCQQTEKQPMCSLEKPHPKLRKNAFRIIISSKLEFCIYECLVKLRYLGLYRP